MGDPEGPPRYTARPLRDSNARSVPLGYISVLAVVVVAAAVILVGPNLLTPAPSAGPTAVPSQDAHIVTTGQGSFEISVDYAGQAFVVSRADGGAELGRGVLPSDGPQLATEQPLNGAWAWALACPGPTGVQPIRIVFGALYPPDNPQYIGPAATWSIADDGLFMVVLNQGFFDPSAQIRMSTKGASIGVDVGSFATALDAGTPEPSGCRVQ